MDALLQLSTTDLTSLASALRSGRLSEPYSEIAIRRHCGEKNVNAVTRILAKFDAEGMQCGHISCLLDAVVTARKSQPSASELVELVWSGPEAIGITNRDTGVVVRELFGSARNEVLVAGFAVYQGREVFRRLAEQMESVPKLKVRLFLDVSRRHGDTTLSSELVHKFMARFRSTEWPGRSLPQLYYDPRSLGEHQEKRSSLHAKCIVVDRKVAFVTSANFTEAAQQRNIEVGAVIRSDSFAEHLCRQFDALLDANALSEIIP